MSIAIKRRKVNPANRLGKCDVCKSVVAIYTCPRCETVTCSLTCVKTHKTQLDCDGVRVRTKYVPVDKMDGSTLLSDYRLLEDVTRCVEFAETRRANLDATQPTVENSEKTADQIEYRQRKDNKEKNKLESVEKVKPNPCDSGPKGHKKKHGRKYRRDMRKLHSITNATTDKTFPKQSAVLVARANRIRNRVLNKTGGKAALPKKSKETKASVDNRNDSNKAADPKDMRRSEAVAQQLHMELKAEESSENKESVESIKSGTKLANTVQNPNVDLSNSCSGLDETLAGRKSRLFKIMKRGGRGKETALETLKKVALKRSIVLKLLPHKFQKHYENRSYFHANENRIYWYLKIAFVNANFSTLSLNQCAESMTLEDVIKCCLKRSRAYSTKNKIKDPLEVYRRLGMSKMTVLMAADKVPNSQKKFYELDMTKSLQENFVGKCILEYPQLCVALQDCFVAPAVKDEVVYNFFDDAEFQEEQLEESDVTAKTVRRGKCSNGTLNNRNSKLQNNGDHDRESGELTDSSDEDSNSDDELFKESEFRSIYTDLLKTIN